jgi:hypothetical protein
MTETTQPNRSPILGVYTNKALGATLKITSANDLNGAISGTFSLGQQSWEVSGTWHTSTIAPKALFHFTGSGAKPSLVVSGAGATPNFKTFDESVISISICHAHGEVNSLQGLFTRPELE